MQNERRSFSTIVAATIATWVASAALASPALAQEGERLYTPEIEVPTEGVESSRAPDGWSPDQAPEPMTWDDYLRRDQSVPAPDTEDPADYPVRTPISLPGEMEASASTPQHISLPNAEGSVEGMGESFSPSLSAGTGTYSVPIALPAGRAGVQPSLALSYGTSAGNGPVGFGWNLGVPFISRQTDRGLPRYDDRRTGWHREEDRFIYNGGQELVPVSSSVNDAFDDGYSPGEFSGWQQYRARIEGGFMRFYRSTDFRTWVVEGPDGSRLEFGALSSTTLPGTVLPSDFGTLASGDNASASALESEEPNGGGRIFRWYLTRMSDAHGSTVYYRYTEDEGSRYISDIYYVSPASCAMGSDHDARRNCNAALANYGRRVHFDYDTTRQDVFDSWVAGWRMATRLRLARVAISAAEGAPGSRSMVRRYHLAYASGSFHSMLQSVQVEGRPAGGATEATMIGARTPIGPVLPAMTFGYSGVDHPTTPTIAGFGGLDGNVRTSGASPPHSVDDVRTDFFDVNADGLPDLLVTDPARYRTSSGRPAVGVFFNGFRGGSTTPAEAGSFSDAVSVPVPAGLSTVFNLSNANVVPMDVDGDGRSDMLHMPRVASYQYFTPVRNGEAGEVRPSRQGWQFAYVDVDLPRGDADPRIDLGSDATHIRTFDVNNDHLIDVVRTTGTVTQTWLNLGWLPGGDGRFGSYRYDAGSDTYQLSTAPYESCLLHSGTPIDFDDPEVQLADMNGDGIQDIVQMRRGRIRYWPGRGLGTTGGGLWGVGPSSCARGEGAGRYIEMDTAPAELNPELAGVYIHDVNQDGAADVVQVRFDEIDVWFNRAGHGFTSRVIAGSTPHAPAFAPRVRFLDIDGSGTTDIVFGNSGRYEWVDFMGGLRPRLLTAVRNGLGALTTLEYGSSASDYLRDLAEAETCSASDAMCDRFTWAPVGGACDTRYSYVGSDCYRSAGSPVISSVVTAVQTTDQFSALGRENTISRNEYRYHDGYYEGIEQEFRGFGAADAYTTAGPADTHRTGVTRTWFHQGRRPNEIASDRLAYSQYEAMKGREYQTESWDSETGTHLATTHSSYVVRELMIGLDGRPVQYAYVRQTDELRYDTSRGFGSEGTAITLPSIAWQYVDSGSPAAIPTDAAADPDEAVQQRGLGTIPIRSTTETVDNHGHVLLAYAYGQPGVDERIEQHTSASRLSGRWLWRQGASYVKGAGATSYGYTTPTYDDNGDLIRSETNADLPSAFPTGFEFGGDSNGAQSFGQGNQVLRSSTTVDAWGNPLASCVGADLASDAATDCLRYGEVDYDEDYMQFPAAERIARDRSSGFVFLETGGEWDRGLGVLTEVTDPTNEVSSVSYDGFGRVTEVHAPAAGVDGSGSPCTSNTVPNQRFEYELAVGGQPISVVRTYAENDCAMVGANTIETRTYVDGLGRTRASLTPASGGDPGNWIQSGITILNQRGTVKRAYQQAWVTESDPTPARAVRIPSTPYEWAGYDAFDRPRCGVSACGQMSCTTYHALTTDACDSLDMSSDPVFAGTCTTTRSDGHGRAVDQILRNRQTPYGTVEYYRLWTDYRADNAVLVLTRAETTTDGERGVAPVVSGHQVQRTFTYDTTGRRIGTTDPDSDSYATGRTATNRTWRYLFSQAGDLVAVRDPRGCGQNFYYDRMGRLIGEDYVECGESQSSGDYPIETIPATALALEEITAARAVDVRYTYDALPTWVTGAFSGEVSITASYVGRLAAVSDRGQRSSMAYDKRGQVTWAVRQMAVIPDAVTIIDNNLNPGQGLPPDTSDSPLTPVARVYDDDHSYERRAVYDYGGRPVSMELPLDPDWETLGGGSGPIPVIGGTLAYDERGLPSSVSLTVDGTPRPIVGKLVYDEHGLVTEITYGDTMDPKAVSTTSYDVCLRPYVFRTERDSTGGTGTDLGLVTTPMHQRLLWDEANNLVRIEDLRDPAEWPWGFHPQTVDIFQDALYRVTDAEYTYSGSASGADDFGNWRNDMREHVADDPMRTAPAPAVVDLNAIGSRVQSLTWQYDWLGNMQEWTDDAHAFYERSLGDIENGADRATPDRPAALHFATDIRQSSAAPSAFEPSTDRGGYVEVDYGEDGDVLALTVHGQCHDWGKSTVCYDDSDLEGDARASNLHSACVCATEQHYEYRWDEINRLVEARRYDRLGGSTGVWSIAVRQRYRYDSANQRTVKQTLDQASGATDPERIALYVYPGDYERRGLVRGSFGDTYDASTGLDTETQYMVGGARVVWKNTGSVSTLDPDQRVTIPLTDLIQTSAAVLDLESGELLETSTYYPNGARETYRAQDLAGIAPEPMGFTGKEGDEEVGLTYFGERYLISRLGRWASPDPLQVHAVGGGEAINGFHYVSGNLLAGRDAIGLGPGGLPTNDLPPSETPTGAPVVRGDWVASNFHQLDEAPAGAPQELRGYRWGVERRGDRNVHWVFRPTASYGAGAGESGTYSGGDQNWHWQEFQISGGATANDDVDTVIDVLTLGTSTVGRVAVRSLLRRIEQETLEESALLAVRLAAGEAGGERIPRSTSRLVLNQGYTSSCVPTSASMVADTHGVQASVEELGREMLTNPNPIGGGTPFGGLVTRAFTQRGIQAEFGLSQSLEQLAARTSRGAPAVVGLRATAETAGVGHAVVVDGVTHIRGIGQVVAIRDPHGVAYFVRAEEFASRWTGQAVYTSAQ